MKKIAFVALLAVGLSGCATMGGTSPENISAKAKEIQRYTQLVCSFVPTIATVANIISSSSAPITTIAQDICSAVTTAPLADGRGKRIDPQVNGVKIKGKFVK